MIPAGTIFSQEVKMISHICVNCGVSFAIPNELDQKLRENRSSFYCPIGHPQSYTKSTLQIARENWTQELDKLKEDKLKLEVYRDSINVEYDALQKRNKKLEARLQKLIKNK